MYFGFILLSLALAIAPSASSQDECKRLGHPAAMHCCTSLTGGDPKHRDDIKECFKDHHPPKPPAPPSCDLEICIGKKMGYSDDKGTVDKEALQKNMESEFKEHPEAVDLIKKKCINGDVSEYGPPNECEVKQIMHCVENQFVLTCTEWDDKPHCQDIKKQAEECRAVMK